MAPDISPRDGSEVAAVRSDTYRVLEFLEGGKGKRAEGIGRTMLREGFCRRTFVLCDKILLELIHILPLVPHVEISREGVLGGGNGG